MEPSNKERRHALRYKPAIAVRAAYEWLDVDPVSIEGAMTDFSVAGVALQYAQDGEASPLASSGRVLLRLGHVSEDFEVTLARTVRWSGGSWLAGLAFPKQREYRVRAARVIERLKAAYRAGAVQSFGTEAGTVARVVGTLNFHVVISLHRLLRGPQPPRCIDLAACTGADQSGAAFLLMARDQGVDLRFDRAGRIGALIERQSAGSQPGAVWPGSEALILSD